MRGLWSTLVLIAVLAGLGAYIYFVDSKRPAGGIGVAGGTGAEPKQKVFTVDSDKIEEIRVTADKQSSVLKKVDNTWRLIEPTQADADQTEISNLTSNIASLEVNRVIDENATDLAQYGLADPPITIAFKGQDGSAGEIYLGDKTPTQSDLYAVRPGEKRVFLVSAFQESTFNKKPFDLRDKRILTFERDKVDLLEIASGGTVIQLARSGSEWSVKQPVAARADYSAIEGLLTRLSSATMSKMVETDATDPATLAKYGLDPPTATLTVGAGSARAMLAVGKEENAETYARDQSRPMVFVIDQTLAGDLKKPVDEYRNKNVFEFRPFNLARLRITRGTDTYEFQKVPAKDAGAADHWQRVGAGGAGTDVDAAKMDDLLSKLSNLRIQSFAPAGAAQAELIVSSSYDEGKFERVRFGRSGTDVLATRDGEPGGGRLETTAYEDMVKALDAVLAPAPTTAK